MGAMTLLITGAAGYIGAAAVAEARARGYAVRALVRNAGRVPARWTDDRGISVVECDLAAPSEALTAAVADVDCTIHCAAGMSGDHGRDTQAATQTLLAALPDGAKLVHVSSIAVYDFAAIPEGEIIAEDAPLEATPARRDAYAAAKLAQEALVRAAAETKGLALTILRPGAVFGPGRLWNAHLGKAIGPVLLRFGRRGQIPLADIGLTARALVAAAERPATDPILVVDDDLPDRVRYLRALRDGPKVILPMHPALARLIWTRETCAARFKPLGFDNARMREVLDVHPDKGFDLLMHEAQP